MKRVLSEFVIVSYFLGKVYKLQCEGESFTRDITISGRRSCCSFPSSSTLHSWLDERQRGLFARVPQARQAWVSRNGAACVSFTRGCLEPVAREGEPPCTRSLP